MAASSKRALWKGAISFGLVHIPVALHSATDEQAVDFDWLDKRSMDPVGYKRINKTTGKDIERENIVKGIEYEDGHYVVLSQEEIAAAYPKTTQTVEIQAFVPISEIPFVYLERPYYISPVDKGAKVYALLREVLHKTQKVGIAKVVIQTKQHLAILMACGPALILNLLRWDEEIRPWDELNLPAEGMDSTGLTKKEMAMGEQLVADMSTKWTPRDFTDSFKEQILQLVKTKVAAGKTEFATQPEEGEAETAGAKIYDLTEILRRSLKNTARTPKSATRSRSKTNSSDSAPGVTAAKSTAGKSRSRKSAPDAKPSVAIKKTAVKKTKSAKTPETGKKTAAKQSGKPAGSGRKAA